jgi:hypothetical protein
MEVIRDYWGLLMAAIGGILWFGRLENRSSQNSKDIENLERRIFAQRAEDQQVNESHRKDVKEALTAIQNDVKTLLQRGGNGP